jgi:hypothetical protein
MSFAVHVGGAPRVVPVGTLVEADDPILRGREQYFEDVETYVSDRASARVEQATAAPGEQRALPRPVAKKTAATKRTERTGRAGPKKEGED